MDRFVLTDAQWAKMAPLCLGKAGDPGRSGKDNRLFVEAVLWIARTGSPWRDLPHSFGHWNSVFTRFRDWVKADVWKRLFDRPPPRNRMVRRRRLHHGLAVPAGEGFPDMLDDLEAPWHVIEGLGYVLADLAQHAAALRTRAYPGMHDLFAGQMFGQCTAGWLYTGLGIHCLGERRDRGDPLGIILLERLDGELELFSRTLDLLGGSPILGAPEPSQLKAQLLDLDPGRHCIPRHIADDAL
jgi:transposase